LNVVPISLPPLRERKEDIPLLATHFFTVFREKNQKVLKDISGKAMDLLMRYDWPGNIRELENCLERAVIIARGEIISPADLPQAIQDLSKGKEVQDLNLPSGISLQEVEKALILQTLQDAGGNRTRASEILGINRRTLQNKLKEYGI
jgi:two-component system response regulator HydG